MRKMTSALANKVLKSLEEDKNYWLTLESNSCLYTAAADEEALIPEYNYRAVSDTINAIDEKICLIRHAINVNNAGSVVSVGEKEMTIDMILVRMAQLNRRKEVLDSMRKRLPKTRVASRMIGARNAVPEFTYINYDLDEVKAEYERISEEIMQMQMALDLYNQTREFEVPLD